MTPEELEAMLIECYEHGAVVGYVLYEKYGDDLSMAEIRARARNMFEIKKEEILNG